MARPDALIGGSTLLFAFRAFSVFFAVDDFSPLSRLQNSSFPSLTDLFARRYLSSDGLFAVAH